MKTELFTNGGFGNPLGEETLDQLESLRWRGVRQDIPHAAGFSTIDTLVHEFAVRDLHPLFILGSFGKNTPPLPLHVVVEQAELVADCCYHYGIPCVVEVLNETDITTMAPQVFASYVTAVWTKLHPEARIISGGITSTSKNALAYLRAAMPDIPETVTIGVHTYRSGVPTTPLPGFPSRQAEFDELKAIVGGRAVWGTEVGWSTAPYKTGCFGLRKKQLTDEQVHDDLVGEYELCKANGFEVMTVYQLNDGPDPNNSYDRFGIFRQDGTPKPSAKLPLEVL